MSNPTSQQQALTVVQDNQTRIAAILQTLSQAAEGSPELRGLIAEAEERLVNVHMGYESLLTALGLTVRELRSQREAALDRLETLKRDLESTDFGEEESAEVSAYYEEARNHLEEVFEDTMLEKLSLMFGMTTFEAHDLWQSLKGDGYYGKWTPEQIEQIKAMWADVQQARMDARKLTLHDALTRAAEREDANNAS